MGDKTSSELVPVSDVAGSDCGDGECIGGNCLDFTHNQLRPMTTQVTPETLNEDLKTTQLEITEEQLEGVYGAIIVNPDLLAELLTRIL